MKRCVRTFRPNVMICLLTTYLSCPISLLATISSHIHIIRASPRNPSNPLFIDLNRGRPKRRRSTCRISCRLRIWIQREKTRRRRDWMYVKYLESIFGDRRGCEAKTVLRLNSMDRWEVLGRYRWVEHLFTRERPVRCRVLIIPLLLRLRLRLEMTCTPASPRIASIGNTLHHVLRRSWP